MLGVPLTSSGQVIAVLNLASALPRAYSERDLGLAMAIGQQIAGPISNTRLYAELKSAEESLRLSEEGHRGLYNHTPVMMHSVDREGHLVTVNDYWLEVLGYERSEVIGHITADFLPKLPASALSRSIDRSSGKRVLPVKFNIRW